MNFLDTALKDTSPESRYFGSLYLGVIIFFHAAGWNFGIYRSSTLAAILLLALSAAFVVRRPGLAVARWICAVLPHSSLAASLVPFLYAVRSAITGHHVRVLDSLIIGCVIVTVFLLTRVPRLRDRPAFRNTAVLVLLAPLLIPLANIASGLIVHDFGDIATTTAEAARAMWSGFNPYELQIDLYGAYIVHDTAYSGYKYLPGMPLVYGPLVFLVGVRSIIPLNAILYGTVGAAIFGLSRKLTGEARYFAILLFLSTPIISESALARERPTLHLFFLSSWRFCCGTVRHSLRAS